MKISRLACGASAAVVLLAGCSGGGLQSSSLFAQSGRQSLASGGRTLGPMGHDHLVTYTSVRAPNVKPDHHKSWVSPDVKRAPRVLFVSDDSSGDVYIFTMPAMQLKGTLTGFSGPQGMCSDKQGNIWVVNTGTDQGLKYSRTGQLLGSVSDPSGTPAGCAVNPTNGDLALSDILGSSGAGGIEVYHNGSGSPTRYNNPSQYEYFFPAYDTNGNLYVDGFSYPTRAVMISELPSGSGTMHTVNYSGGTIGFPGGVNWDRVNGQLVVNDQECHATYASCVYQLTVSGSSATIVGATALNNFDGTACDVDQGTIAPFSKYFAGPCITFAYSVSSVDRWAYPSGGTPGHYNDSVVLEPIGSAISDK
ncbi:MAG: hypothetical protein WBP75_12780 [Candidatus Cybelea sp.]